MNFWIFGDKPNKRIVFIALNAKPAMGGKPLFPREDHGTDRIPTTMRQSAKQKRCLHGSNQLPLLPPAILAQTMGRERGSSSRQVTEKLVDALVRRHCEAK